MMMSATTVQRAARAERSLLIPDGRANEVHMPAPGTAEPIVFILSSEAGSLQSDLNRRCGSDARINSGTGAEAGLARLTELAGRPRPVAVLIAEQRMPEMTGVEFLRRAHPLHPDAKRILLLERDRTVSDQLETAIAGDEVDHHLVKAWDYENRLGSATSAFLAAWATPSPEAPAPFRIVAERDSARGRDIRGLFSAFGKPFVFHPTDSLEGASLLCEIARPSSCLPLVVCHDGGVLVDPSNGALIDELARRSHVGRVSAAAA